MKFDILKSGKYEALTSIAHGRTWFVVDVAGQRAVCIATADLLKTTPGVVSIFRESPAQKVAGSFPDGQGVSHYPPPAPLSGQGVAMCACPSSDARRCTMYRRHLFVPGPAIEPDEDDYCECACHSPSLEEQQKAGDWPEGEP